MEFLFEYGLFLAKAITIVMAIALTLALILSLVTRNKSGSKGELSIHNLSDELDEQQRELTRALLSKEDKKAFDKAEKKNAKQRDKQDQAKDVDKDRMFIVDFDGDINASATDSLREEISAIISIAKPSDQVLINIESAGGVVHGYGLAASQIARLKQHNIHTTVAVDKVAASGGYMMACVADHIIAAPFAIIGSIGVVAQLPNINKLLKKNHIDVEQHTAGEFKRTLTVIGENTEEGRTKFKQELEQTHGLFKQFVQQHRPDLAIDKVATGEHWYGQQAIELGLVDEIQTSDDYILHQHKQRDLYLVEYKLRKNVAEKLGLAAAAALTSSWSKLASFSLTRGK